MAGAGPPWKRGREIARGDLRAVAAQELVREIIPEVHARGDGAVWIGAVGYHLGAVGQDAGARDFLTEPIADIRVIEVEHTICKDVREDRRGAIGALDLHLKDAAFAQSFAWIFIATPFPRTRDDDLVAITLEDDVAIEHSAAVIGHFARKNDGALTASDVELVRRAG